MKILLVLILFETSICTSNIQLINKNCSGSGTYKIYNQTCVCKVKGKIINFVIQKKKFNM